MKAVETKGLTKKFGTTVALDHLNLSVEAGEIFALVGPDGAGKTTTIRLLAALMDPTEGIALVDGLDTVQEGERIKERIGMMSQRFGLYQDLTVEENIEFYADIYNVPRSERKKKVEELLEFSQLAPFRDRLADKLSGGMKQKLALSSALIHRPKILFLDEPTNGVDPVSRRDFWRILYRLHREGVTIFFTTSYMDEAERAGRLAFLHQGKLLADGSIDEIKGLLNGAILEIAVSDPRKVYTLFRAALHTKGVRLVGNKIHIVTPDPEKTADGLNAFFQKNGIAGYEIRSCAPSLEDIFVSVSQEEAFS